MKVNCLSCGHNLALDDAYDDFQGPYKCYVCGTLLELITNEGQVKSVNLVEAKPQPKTSGKDIEKFL